MVHCVVDFGQEMAMMSSTTAVAAIAPHNAGSLSSLVTYAAQSDHVTEKPHGLAEKLHGLTEKIQNLGHHRSDSDSSTRLRPAGMYACLPFCSLFLRQIFSLYAQSIKSVTMNYLILYLLIRTHCLV